MIHEFKRALLMPFPVFFSLPFPSVPEPMPDAIEYTLCLNPTNS